MFRHGWPRRELDDSSPAANSTDKQPTLLSTWNALHHHLQSATAGASDARRHVVGGMLDALQRLQLNQPSPGQPSRAPAFACISSSAVDKPRKNGTATQDSVRIQSEGSSPPQVQPVSVTFAKSCHAIAVACMTHASQARRNCWDSDGQDHAGGYQARSVGPSA